MCLWLCKVWLGTVTETNKEENSIRILVPALERGRNSIYPHRAIAPSNQEADILAQAWTLANDLSVDIADWVHRKRGHHSTQVEWRIDKNAGLPLIYSDLVNVVTACPMCSKQYLRQLPKGSGATEGDYWLLKFPIGKKNLLYWPPLSEWGF